MSHIGAALCVVLLLGGALGVAQTVLLSMAGAAVAYSRFGALQNGFRRADLQNKLDPFMIHELLPSLTETASRSHPCCVVSVTYDRTPYFHGDVTDEKVSGGNRVRSGSNKLANEFPWVPLKD